MAENEMVGWHHQLDGHGFGWTPGVADGQGGLACCSSWGHKDSDMTERLNRTELILSSSRKSSLILQALLCVSPAPRLTSVPALATMYLLCLSSCLSPC